MKLNSHPQAMIMITKRGYLCWLVLSVCMTFGTQSDAGNHEFDLLLFTKTVGFEHPAISDAVTAIQAMGADEGFAVTATDQASVFTTANLKQYDAVVFLMTTGDVLNAAQQTAFETYVGDGGGFVGVHSASDTEYDWPWYGQLVGAYFNNHPSIQTADVVVANDTHPSSQGLPAVWTRTDEWYNFQSNPRDNPNITVLATVDEPSYNGGNMGADHPVIWYQPFAGGRSWYTALGHTPASYSDVLFLQHLLGGIKYAAGVAPADPLVVDESGQWFKKQNSDTPFFMAGVGGPEGFLYETDARKQAIVDDLIASGANALYMHSIRSFAGDGWGYEDPFVIHEDASSGVADGVFANWRGYLTQLDANQIVTWLHVIDDTARPWGCDVPLNQDAKDYIEALVTSFRDLDHLVWLSGEEYLMGVCDAAQDKALMEAIAAEIRLHDKVHPIAVHHNNNQAMQFADDPNISVFAQQTCGSAADRSPEGVHSKARFDNRWVYVMSECHPWHLNLLHDNDRNQIRQSNWGTALGGGYMLLYNAYECQHGGKLCSRNSAGDPATISDPHDPSTEVLADLNRIREFMTASRFNRLTPDDSLATDDTLWVSANTAEGWYVLYAKDSPTQMGVSGLAAGEIKLHWFDPITGSRETFNANGSDSPFAVPSAFSTEAALFIERTGVVGNRPPMAFADNYSTPINTTLAVNNTSGVLSNDFDADGDLLNAVLVDDVSHGVLQLDNDGGFSYQPNNGYEGLDGFTYQANDAALSSQVAAVNIQVGAATMRAMLVNSTSNTQFAPISNGQQIAVSQLGFTEFSIEALQVPQGTNSVRLSLTGPINQTQAESVAPYALFGDNKGDFDGAAIVNGDYTLVMEAFSATAGGGALLETVSINFAFVDELDDLIFTSGFE